MDHFVEGAWDTRAPEASKFSPQACAHADLIGSWRCQRSCAALCGPCASPHPDIDWHSTESAPSSPAKWHERPRLPT